MKKYKVVNVVKMLSYKKRLRFYLSTIDVAFIIEQMKVISAARPECFAVSDTLITIDYKSHVCLGDLNARSNATKLTLPADINNYFLITISHCNHFPTIGI